MTVGLLKQVFDGICNYNSMTTRKLLWVLEGAPASPDVAGDDDGATARPMTEVKGERVEM